ncbi:MAG TPA: hypothetical protein VF530_08400 [Planctomycetota bacterium]
MRGATLLVLAAGGLGACRMAGKSPAELEAELRRDVRTVLEGELVTLHSPYGEVESRDYLGVTEREAGLVRARLDAPREPKVRTYLAPTTPPQEIWEAPHHDDVAGWASDGFLTLYVSSTPGLAALRAEFQDDTLRHELAHVYARRLGWSRERWFNEGLACVVEETVVRAGVLQELPVSERVIQARAEARAGSLATLLAWAPGQRLSLEEQGERYAQAEALVRFLLARAPGASWPERVAWVHERTQAQVQELEPQWLAWLAELDTVAALRAHAVDAAGRLEAASLLAPLLEAGAQELATRAGDELALELLTDPACTSGAISFLLFFRAEALTEPDLEALERAQNPVLRLVAGALRTRRGEPVDRAGLSALWNALTESERERYATLAFVLELE